MRRVAWLAWLALAFAALACGGAKEVVPNALIGRWACADARYAGRTLTISQRSLIFAASQTASENFTVRSVRSHDLEDGSLQVAIDYGNDASQDLSLNVRVYPTQPASLRIGDRAERWTLLPAVGALP